MISQSALSTRSLIIVTIIVGLLGVGAFGSLVYAMKHSRLCYATNYEEQPDSSTGEARYIVTCDGDYQQVCGYCAQDSYTGKIDCDDCFDLVEMTMK